MKKATIVFASMVISVLLAAWCWHLSVDSQWCMWVNRVHIAGQPGSTAREVIQILGAPSSVIQPQAVGRGFTPKPKIPNATTESYVYHKLFVGAGGYWVAYVFLDSSGNVTGVHIAES